MPPALWGMAAKKVIPELIISSEPFRFLPLEAVFFVLTASFSKEVSRGTLFMVPKVIREEVLRISGQLF